MLSPPRRNMSAAGMQEREPNRASVSTISGKRRVRSLRMPYGLFVPDVP
jgi:hypothetical protein